MICRFEGDTGQAALVEALLEQKLVMGNDALAKQLVEVGSLEEVPAQSVLITQASGDSDVYFIVTGQMQIKVNERDVAVRVQGDHVGEIAALVPTAKRSATVVALEHSIVLRVSSSAFKAIADQFPCIWKHVTRQLADRLGQRNAFVQPVRETACVFIICSVEALPIAYAIQDQFEHDKIYVKPWTQGVFRASQYSIESLEEQLDECDFAIAIAQPDDITEVRGEAKRTPRDNVIFELGLFIGRLGRARSFLLEPRGENVHLPSDIMGLTKLEYRYSEDVSELPRCVAYACNQLRAAFKKLGPR